MKGTFYKYTIQIFATIVYSTLVSPVALSTKSLKATTTTVPTRYENWYYQVNFPLFAQPSFLPELKPKIWRLRLYYPL